MQAKGWEAIPGANWKWLMQALNPEPAVYSLPLLNKDYLGHPEVLVLRKKLPGSERQLTFRVWDSGTRLSPGEQPLYLAQMSVEGLQQRLAVFSYWRALPVQPGGLEKLLTDLADFESRTAREGLLLFSVGRSPQPARQMDGE